MSKLPSSPYGSAMKYGLTPQLDDVFQDEEQGVGDEQDHHLVFGVHEAQDAALDQRPDHDGDQDRGSEQNNVGQHRRHAIRQERAGNRCRRIRAERIEAAVRHIDDLHDAVDQRQSDRRNEQPGRIDDAVDDDRDDFLHRTLERKNGCREGSRSSILKITS